MADPFLAPSPSYSSDIWIWPLAFSEPRSSASSRPSQPEPWPSSLSLPPTASLPISGGRWIWATEWPQRSPREAGVCPDIRGIVNLVIICSPPGTQTSQLAGASRPMLSLEYSPHFLSPCWAPTVPHLSLWFPPWGSLPGPHNTLGSLCGAARGQKNAPLLSLPSSLRGHRVGMSHFQTKAPPGFYNIYKVYEQ